MKKWAIQIWIEGSYLYIVGESVDDILLFNSKDEALTEASKWKPVSAPDDYVLVVEYC
jgi:hypothetical protein